MWDVVDLICFRVAYHSLRALSRWNFSTFQSSPSTLFSIELVSVGLSRKLSRCKADYLKWRVAVLRLDHELISLA